MTFRKLPDARKRLETNSTSQSSERTNSLTLWCQNFSLQICETINFCCSSHLVCGTLLQQPPINILPNSEKSLRRHTSRQSFSDCVGLTKSPLPERNIANRSKLKAVTLCVCVCVCVYVCVCIHIPVCHIFMCIYVYIYLSPMLCSVMSDSETLYRL